MTITALVPAHGNDTTYLKQCLNSVRWCDEILILWMGGTKPEFFSNKEFRVVEKLWEGSTFVRVQKAINWGVTNVSSDWILRVDADEVVTDELRSEILNITKNKKAFDAYGIPRKQFFLGEFLKGGDWAYDKLVRLFRRTTARYLERVSVHEQLQVKGSIGFCTHALLHYSHPTLKSAVDKFNIYTNLEIQDIHIPIYIAYVRMIFMPPYIFLRWFFYHHGYLDGIRGVVAGIMRGWYDFLLWSKYIKSKKNTTAKTV